MQYDVFLPGVFRSVLKYYKKKYPQVGEDLKQILHLVVKNPDIGKTNVTEQEIRSLLVRIEQDISNDQSK